MTLLAIPPQELSWQQTLISNALERATSAGAIAVGPLIGSGDSKEAKDAIDQAAVTAIHEVLGENHSFSAEVVIGEGEKDEAPMLAHGDILGYDKKNVRYDLAGDPVDGTTLTALGKPGGLSILALSECGNLTPDNGTHYMRKLVVGPKAADRMSIGGYLNIAGDERQNLREVASALRKDPNELVVAVLDRARNARIISAAKAVGVRLMLLEHGDVLPALQTCVEDQEIDMLYGSGGAPEAVLTAAAVAGLGGNMQAMWDPQTPAERNKVDAVGQLGMVLQLADLVGTGNVHFSASAITDNPMMQGVRRTPGTSVWQPGNTLTTFRPALAE